MIPLGPIIWVAIFALRAMSRDRDQRAGKPAPEVLDGVMFLVILCQVGAVLVVLAFVGWGWPQVLFASWAVAVWPQWVAWRLCQPRGLRRLGVLLVATAPRGAVARAGRRRLFEWSLGEGHADEGPPELPATLGRTSSSDSALVTADAWTTCAAALRAEARGDAPLADRLARGLTHLPAKPRVPPLVARVGFELLAFAAFQRDDWPAVLQRASLGRGRGCRFLRLLARAHLRRDVPAAWLWLAWLAAPRRRRMQAAVKIALAPPTDRGAPVDAPPARSPWAFHVRALGRAAAGERIERRKLLHLARLWDGPLGAGGLARLRARALELGVVDPETAVQAVRTELLEDLDALASVAVGPWPPGADDLSGSVSGVMLGAAENRLYADLEPWVEPYRLAQEVEIRYPLVEWERWLSFQEDLGRVEEALGEGRLATCWYGGVRLAAWNWPCRILDLHQERAAWICHVMFQRTVELAELVGDEEAARVNRENAATALGMIPR
jgi:hypothetical protein